MSKKSLRLLCEAVSKKRKGVYGTIRSGAVLPTTHGTHGTTRLMVHVLSKGPVSSLELSPTDTTLNGYRHGFTGAPLEHCSSPAVCLCTHCLGPLVHARSEYE